MKVLVNKGVECCIEIQFNDSSYSLTPESAKQLVVELEKVLEDIPIESEEILKDFYSPRLAIID